MLSDDQVEEARRRDERKRQTAADAAEWLRFYKVEIEAAEPISEYREAQRIFLENPQWMTDAELELSDTQIATAARLANDESIPKPNQRNGLVRLCRAFIERRQWIHDDQQWECDVRLLAEGFAKTVARASMNLKDFDRNVRTGEPNPANPDNVRAFLKMHSVYIRWNAWYSRIEVGIALPGHDAPSKWDPLTDTRIAQMMTQAGDSQHCFRPAEVLFRRTIETIAQENIVDPILDHVNGLRWDGESRLETWLSRACGVPNDLYHQSVGMNVIGGMVKRARVPGAKHDEVMVLIGPQGTYKSTLCQTLAWKPEYFTDSVAFEGSPQNMVPLLFGKWVIELSEMDGLASRETSFLKRFIAARSDNVTLKYKAFAFDFARRCVFIGTSNDDRVLRDATGNRRFLPVKIDGKIDIAWIKENLDQVIAEAAELHSEGCEFLIPEEVIPAAQCAQEAARAEAEFETYLNGWFEHDDTAAFITPSDLASLLKDAVGRSVPSNRYGATMKRLGFVEATKRFGGKVNRVWRRGNDVENEQRIVLHRDGSNRFVPRVIVGVTPPLPPEINVTSLPLIDVTRNV